MRIIGLDVHRTFAEVAIREHGRVRPAGRISTTTAGLQLFARGLTHRDEVVLEATCNTHAIARLLRAHAGRVVVSNLLRTRAIAEAKIKTDKIDAAVLTQLHASGFLPEVWMPDATTEALRRQVSRRAQIVRHRTRLKNQVHAILHRNLVPRCPASDLFGRKGRAWLAIQSLPPDERAAVTSLLRALDHADEDLAELDRQLAGAVLEDTAIRRLMTIPGVDFAVAVGLIAAIGDVTRFRSPQKLVSYFGLNPRVRQSGLLPAQHGLTRTTSRRSARESGRSGSKRSGRTRRWSPTGDPSGRNGARAPPRRHDVDTREAQPARRSFQPLAPLFGRGRPCPEPFYRRLSVTRTAA